MKLASRNFQNTFFSWTIQNTAHPSALPFVLVVLLIHAKVILLAPVDIIAVLTCGIISASLRSLTPDEAQASYVQRLNPHTNLRNTVY